MGSIRAIHLFAFGLTCVMSQLEPIIQGVTQSSVSVDVVVVTDISGSGNSEEAVVLQTFLQLLSGRIGVSEDGSHMSLVSVGSTTDTVLSLSEGVSIDAVANAFAQVQSGDGSVEDLTLDLVTAIQNVYEDVLSRPDNRPEVPDIVVAVTGGHSDIGSTAVTYAVTTVVVAVGEDVNITVFTNDDGNEIDEQIEEFRKQLMEIQRRLNEILERLRELQGGEDGGEGGEGGGTDGDFKVFFSLCEYKETLFYRKEEDSDGNPVCLWFWRRRCDCLVINNRITQYRRSDEKCNCTMDECPVGGRELLGGEKVDLSRCDEEDF